MIKLVLQDLFVFLDEGHSRKSPLKLTVLLLPDLDLLEPGLQDTVNTVILRTNHVDLRLVLCRIVLQILVVGKLRFL